MQKRRWINLKGWIEKKRQERIARGDAKKGPWTAENFLATGRSGLGELIPELIDSINYAEMAWKIGEISEGFYLWLKSTFVDLILRIDLEAEREIKIASGPKSEKQRRLLQ
jgi:hypothetical protein